MRYITVKPCGGSAGIGHQFCNWLVPYMLSKKYDIGFVHQPFVGETDGTFSPRGSNFNQITRPVKEWNNFLNFSEGELTLGDLPKNIKTIQIPFISQEQVTWDHQTFKNFLEMDLNPKYQDILFKVNEYEDGQFINIDWDFYRNNDLKKKYNNSEQVKNMKSYFNNDYLNVAIHIRRGDVTKEKQYGRWIDLTHYLRIIENINKVNLSKPTKYHIYTFSMSDDEIEQLSMFKIKNNLNIEFHIDENVFSTFYHLTKSDVFVSGQGAFSLLANYLTNAIKLTSPWQEYVNNRWIVYWNYFPKDIEDIIEIENNGSFDTEKLIKMESINNE